MKLAMLVLFGMVPVSNVWPVGQVRGGGWEKTTLVAEWPVPSLCVGVVVEDLAARQPVTRFGDILKTLWKIVGAYLLFG